jgi:cobalt-zinc-cadmium efflux system outer membrane protein
MKRASFSLISVVVWCGALVVPGLVSMAAPPERIGPSGETPPLGPVTVAALVDEVLTRNPELSFYQAELKAARGELRSAGQFPNPELAPQVAQKRSLDPEGNLQGEGVAWTVAVSQTFEWPGRLALRKSIANRQVSLAEAGVEQFRAALAARARTLATDLAVASKLAESTRTIADRFLALQEIVVQRDPAGVTPLLETRILEANSITYRRRAAESRQAAQRALLELNQLRGQPPEQGVQVLPADFRFAEAPPLDRLLALAFTNSFVLRQRRVELEQQGFRVELARNERYPSITVTPYYTRENSYGQDRFAGVSLSVPLPLWNRNQGAIEGASARASQAQTSLQLAQRAVEREIIERVTAYEARREEMSHCSGPSPASRRSTPAAGTRSSCWSSRMSTR